MGCPIKTSKEYNHLVKQVGEYWAVATYMTYGESYPTLYTNTQLIREMDIPYKSYNTAKAAIRVDRYNAKNGTSHRFKKTLIGESTQYAIKFIPSYLPVNVLRKMQKEFDRKENDKHWNTLDELDDPEIHGIEESLPERSVTILGNSQYEANGEIYPSYEDAIDAVEESDVDISPAFTTSLQSDLDNMNITHSLLDYLYTISTGRVPKERFSKEITKLIQNMSGSFNNQDIIEAIKCI